ncbi:MAG: hypothetical protein R2746_08195 [Acidimicrobiales bacterium]
MAALTASGVPPANWVAVPVSTPSTPSSPAERRYVGSQTTRGRPPVIARTAAGTGALADETRTSLRGRPVTATWSARRPHVAARWRAWTSAVATVRSVWLRPTSLPAGSRFTGMPCQRLTNTLAPLVRREP